MSFFESLLLLLGVAILLLQVSRRLCDPLSHHARGRRRGAGAGPRRAAIRPRPADRARAVHRAGRWSTPPSTSRWRRSRSLWRPLFALAVVAVVLSAAAVAWLGVLLAGLPIYAAIALGAIVAPPDAAAADGGPEQRQHAAPVGRDAQGREPAQRRLGPPAVRGRDLGLYPRAARTAGLALRVAIAVPGGVLLGIVLALAFRRWIVPLVVRDPRRQPARVRRLLRGLDPRRSRLGLSAVLCLVAFAMTIARDAGLTTPARVAHPELRGLGRGGLPAQRPRLPADGPAGARDRRRHDARPLARGRHRSR